MKIQEIFHSAYDRLDGPEDETLRRSMLRDNIRRGRLLALAIIGFEAVFVLIDIGAGMMKAHETFRFSSYLCMYTAMILVNLLYLRYIGRYRHEADIPMSKLRRLERRMAAYMIFIMTWGSVVSLMDQKLYGQLMAFMVNLMICSVFYLSNIRRSLRAYGIATGVLYLALPFFQTSSDILVGHYVNGTVFIALSWLASRIIYLGYCSGFRSREMLERSKAQLQQEAQQNRIMNQELSAANLQLKELALVDELTGLANRRGFRRFLEAIMEERPLMGKQMSVMMLDIDFFKSYNDCFGHGEGDKVIQAVGDRIKASAGQGDDQAVRWGGEEFAYVAFGMDAGRCRETAESIRRGVLDMNIPSACPDYNDQVTVSIGTCTVDIGDSLQMSGAIERADQALYFAKQSGHNCVKDIEEVE